MDDWQGCLSPTCQQALQQARQHVTRRGGLAISAEDFLLALLALDTGPADYLRRRGIDLDELTRAIQAEQPPLAAVTDGDMLSAQLRYWLALARELSPCDWLDWPDLLRVLTQQAERLAGKGYVALLESVPHWPHHTGTAIDHPSHQPAHPLTVLDEAWYQLAEDVCLALASNPRALIWLNGPPGSGKTSWLQLLTSHLFNPFQLWDMRQLGLLRACTRSQLPVATAEQTLPTALLVDPLSASTAQRMSKEKPDDETPDLYDHLGPILLVGSLPEPASDQPIVALAQHLGRRLQKVTLPPCSRAQLSAILYAHQPEMERRWQVRFTRDALEQLADHNSPDVTPGQALELMAQAALRQALVVQQGPRRLRLDRQRLQHAQRCHLIALARQQPTGDLEHQIASLQASVRQQESDWQQRQYDEKLHQAQVEGIVMPDDLTGPLSRYD
ncbi:MAG: hypothetical protein LAT63_00735 [Marinobacter sp.]|nr:hypothetical protein [Marinobacter sp.]